MAQALSISIVTDSTSDIPENLVEDYQITIVPNILVIDGHSLEDGKDITREEFYHRLPTLNSTPTTSTASSGMYQEIYESLFARGASQIISIHAPSNLSGIYNAARLAASHFENRVRVIDSGQLSLGLGFQVLTAADAARRGESIQNIEFIVSNLQKFVRVIAMLDTLEYVRRSGRVSWARARLGNLLNLKSFIEVRDGKVLSIGETRTRQKGMDRLIIMLKELAPFERLAILHSNAEDDARTILDQLKQILTLPNETYLVNITTIIGVHVGPNGLGFAAVLKHS